MGEITGRCTRVTGATATHPLCTARAERSSGAASSSARAARSTSAQRPSTARTVQLSGAPYGRLSGGGGQKGRAGSPHRDPRGESRRHHLSIVTGDPFKTVLARRKEPSGRKKLAGRSQIDLSLSFAPPPLLALAPPDVLTC